MKGAVVLFLLLLAVFGQGSYAAGFYLDPTQTKTCTCSSRGCYCDIKFSNFIGSGCTLTSASIDVDARGDLNAGIEYITVYTDGVARGNCCTGNCYQCSSSYANCGVYDVTDYAKDNILTVRCDASTAVNYCSPYLDCRVTLTWSEMCCAADGSSCSADSDCCSGNCAVDYEGGDRYCAPAGKCAHGNVKENSFTDNFEDGSLGREWSCSGSCGVSTKCAQKGKYAAYHKANAGSVTSKSLDLSDAKSGTISYWVRKGSDRCSENPDSGEDFFVEYYGANGAWSRLDSFYSSSMSNGEARIVSHTLPTNAFHSNFRVRFRQRKGSGDNYDYWHFDDVKVVWTSGSVYFYSDGSCSPNKFYVCSNGDWIDHCTSGRKDCDEEGVDCGGAHCDPCNPCFGQPDNTICDTSKVCCNQECVTPVCTSDSDCGSLTCDYGSLSCTRPKCNNPRTCTSACDTQTCDYCSNCPLHCGDGSCNCGETTSSCPDDCGTFVFSLTLNPGWNLISIPGKSVSGIESDSCNLSSKNFYYYDSSTKEYKLYSWNELEGGKGYWVYSSRKSACQVKLNLSSALRSGDFPTLNAGYNLVGSLMSPKDINLIKGSCTIIDGPYYWSTKGWTHTNTLEPGNGYWLKVVSKCNFS